MSEELKIIVDVYDKPERFPPGFPDGRCLILQVQQQETTLGLFWLSLQPDSEVVSNMIEVLIEEISNQYTKV